MFATFYQAINMNYRPCIDQIFFQHRYSRGDGSDTPWWLRNPGSIEDATDRCIRWRSGVRMRSHCCSYQEHYWWSRREKETKWWTLRCEEAETSANFTTEIVRTRHRSGMLLVSCPSFTTHVKIYQEMAKLAQFIRCNSWNKLCKRRIPVRLVTYAGIGMPNVVVSTSYISGDHVVERVMWRHGHLAGQRGQNLWRSE